MGVFVGYMDGLRPSPFVPVPWFGGANVNFNGTGVAPATNQDDGAVRIDNGSGSPVTVDKVTVDIGSSHTDIWPSNMTVPARSGVENGHLILTGNLGDNFDSSDLPSLNANCGSPFSFLPVVHVTIAGSTTDLTDSEQILNTKGVDKASCPQNTNESTPWTAIGTPNAPPVLTVADQTVETTDPLSFTVQATDPEGDLIVLTATNLPSGMTFTDNGNGTGSASGTPALAAGASQVVNVCAQDGFNPPVCKNLTITAVRDETGTHYTGPTVFTTGGPAALSATLAEGDGTKLPAGTPVTVALGTQSCVGGTDASGNVSCTIPTITQGPGSVTASASFAGDSTFTPSADSTLATIGKATPSLTTTASASVAAGQTIFDTATLTGGVNPTGTVTFQLFGPNDPSCSHGSAFTSTTGVTSGHATSDPFTAAAGTYNWVATYNGDANNATTSNLCGATGETVIVTKASPALTTSPSGSVPAGGTISDTALLTNCAAPKGMITFTLYGPMDGNCSALPVATKVVTVLGNGSYSSGGVTAGPAGTYNWIATYSGDANNNMAASACGSETVTVTPQILTGRAFGISLGGLLTLRPTPDTGPVATPSASTTSTPCVARLNALGVLSAQVLCANVTTALGPPQSTATASVASTKLAAVPVPAISIGAAQSSSTTSCAGSSGSTTIASLKVGNTVVIPAPTNVAPNTTINLGLVKIVLNEQIPVTGPDKGLTVNAVHITILANGGVINLIVASSSSDIGNCP